MIAHAGLFWLCRISVILVLFFFSSALATESKPPLLAEGELFPNYQELIANISRSSPVDAVAFSPDGKTLAWLGGPHSAAVVGG